MATKTINVDVLAKMFLAGAQNIEAKKDYINELNVFPVPDGDTGTNMSMTIMSAAKEVTALNKPAMKDLAKAISSGSLRGARGNSGVILSQLFRGFTKSIKEEQVLDIPVLTRAFEKAVETAYKAVMKPKEGTILTVAKGASDKAKELCEDGADDLEQFLGTVIEHARYVLSQTPEMLPVLKQAGVVDSGGQGLVEVLSGAYDAFLGKEIDLTVAPAAATKAEDTKSSLEVQAEAEIKFGYCTEFIILLNKPFNVKAEMDFKAFLESIGDSIVCVADDDVVKVHVHTNDPGLAIQKALKYGALSNMKIDNMRLEHQEKLFKLSEKEFLKLVLHICSDLSDLELKLSNVEVRFTRRNYENIAQKATVLTTMLANPKIAPVLAFTHSGMFSDPQLAYRMSMDYAEEQEKKAAELATKQKEVNPDGEGNPPDPGSGQTD